MLNEGDREVFLSLITRMDNDTGQIKKKGGRSTSCRGTSLANRGLSALRGSTRDALIPLIEFLVDGHQLCSLVGLDRIPRGRVALSPDNCTAE